VGKGDAWLVGSIGKECSDSGDGYPGDAAREASGGGRGEEEFVVFASVECGVKSLIGGEAAGERMERDRGGVDLGSEARRFAEVGEVGGEAVADVDGGGGETAAKECGSHVEAGLGV
jgi:hypothetical protein